MGEQLLQPHGIRLLVQHPNVRRKMSKAAYNFARIQTWEYRAKQINTLYEECVRNISHEDHEILK
jgi:hypothetical protein